jgi:hypothetical protein
MLKPYIYGYLNRVPSSRRLERGHASITKRRGRLHDNLQQAHAGWTQFGLRFWMGEQVVTAQSDLCRCLLVLTDADSSPKCNSAA